MKKGLGIFVLAMIACSPVLDRRLADKAVLNVPLESMVQYPLLYKADLYLLGGLIIETKQTDRGFLIEALYIPVNERGYIKDQELAQGTYLALLPDNGPGADELTYRPGTYITIAAGFIATEKGIKSRDVLPLFSVREIHSWGSDYTKAFSLPPGQPALRPEDRPIEPSPVWENPVSP